MQDNRNPKRNRQPLPEVEKDIVGFGNVKKY